MKRLLLLMCGLMSLVVSAHAANGDQFTYTYNGISVKYSVISESEKTCRIGQYGISGSEKITLELPENPIYNGIPYTLVEIGAYAFYNCTGLTSVTIPASVTTIGYRAFSGCTGLTSVTIPESVTTIGDYAFVNCTGLTTVTIPESVTTIGERAFVNCTGLTTVTIPESVTTIGERAFFGCTGLTSMTIPESVTTISAYTFAVCTGLTSMTIPESVTSIGEGAFSGCTGLTSVTIPESVTTIGEGAFANCTGLTSMTIPESVTSIGEGAFSGCTGLTDINVENGNKYFCSYLGVLYNYDKTSLIVLPGAKTSIDIAPTVNSIYAYAFAGCTGLTEVTIPESVTSIGAYAFYGCTGLTSMTIPESVTSIGEWAFANCTGLTSMTIPNSVTTIGEFAFYGCTDLASVTIPESVTSISAYAFYGCTALTFIEIPNSVVRIYEMAFYNCSGLTSVLIGDSSHCIIDRTAFYGCRPKKVAYPSNISNPFDSYFTAIQYPSGKCTIENGVIFDQTKTTLYFAPTSISGEYTVPSTVETIGENAFQFCKDITYIHMPATLSSIGRNAFKDCNFYEFAIPDAVKSFDMGSLSGNPLKSLTVGAGVTEISDATSSFSAGMEKIFWLGDIPPVGFRDINAVVNFVSNDQYDFENQIIYPFLSSIFEVDGIKYVPVSASEETCNVIGHLYAPSHTTFSVPAIVTNNGIQMKVVDIGAYAFYYNNFLTEISLDNNGVIDDYAFYNCAKLESVTFGNNIPEIKNHTFEKCKALKEVESSPALTSIGEWAFAGCVGMKYFSVGDKITSLGEKAFSDCTGLKEFYSYATTPPVCGEEALEDINKLKCTLHVPEASKSLYASAPQWKYFLYFEFIEAGVDNILIDHNNNLEIYDLKGIKQTKRLEDLPAGIYIVRQGNKVTKIAVN